MSLTVSNLSVTIADKQILKEVSLEVGAGKLVALMGPNGSGKSSLAQVMMGHPAYNVTPSDKTSIKIGNEEIKSLSPDKRAGLGLFLAFQNPVSVPGVNVANLLRTALKEKTGVKKGNLANPIFNPIAFHEDLYKKSQKMNINPDLLKRGLNEDFSGGEKKKLEMLQAQVLNPKFAIFDEIDTGLDVDALKIVAQSIAVLKKNGAGVLLITHYQRILKFAKPDVVYILVKGEIKEKGNADLAKTIEKEGYKRWSN